MKSIRREPFIIFIAIAGALGIGIGWYLGSSLSPSHEPAVRSTGEKGGGQREALVFHLSSEQKRKLGLKIETAELRVPKDNLSVTGRVSANLEKAVPVSPRIRGRVEKVLVRLGDTVDPGTPLALLDSVEVTDVLAEMDQAEASFTLAQARAEKEKEIYNAKLRVLETARRQDDASQAEAALAKVELGRPKQEYIGALARLELARANYERQQLLVERKIGARKDLVKAEKALISARGELEAVTETIRLTARQDLFATETALQQTRAERDRVRKKLELFGLDEAMRVAAAKKGAGQRMVIPLSAPFRGTVIDRQISEGQLVDPGWVAFRLADLTRVWVLLDVPETLAGKVQKGQEVLIEVSEGGIKKAGRVTYIGDVVDEQTRTVKVRADLPNPDRKFKPGMFVTARITMAPSAQPALMLPDTSIFLLDEGPVVFVESKDGIAPRPVEIGTEFEKWVVIRQGLAAGERVVTEGGFALKAQMLKNRFGEE